MPDWKKEIQTRLPKSSIDPSLMEELAQHLEDRYRELLAAGEDSVAAESAVLLELANAENLPRPKRELSRVEPVSSANLLADFARDLRYGARVLTRTPIFTFFAALTLGLGIGANTTVFTIVNTLLLHPLPIDDTSRLVSLFNTDSRQARDSGRRLALAYANYEDYARQPSGIEGAVAFTPPRPMTLRGRSGPERMFGEFVTAQYFDTLGLKPATGRFFLPEEASRPGSAPVAVLSYNAWNARFGSSPDAIGRTLELNNVAFTIIGVAPKRFLGLSAIFGPDVWIPATMAERAFPADFRNALTDRGKPFFHVIARLKTGVTMKQAQTALEPVAASLAREYPAANEGRGISVRPVTEEVFSSAGGQSGFLVASGVLLAVVALVLGIACSNVANLLLARATARRQEVAVRLAIGANRGRLIRQMLTESLLLSLLSCGAGLLVGYAGCNFVWSFVPPEVSLNMVAPKLDANVFLYALLVSLLTAFVFGLAPAMRASKTDVVSTLKEETRTAGRGRRGVTFANALLVGQVAFSLLCLITATLFFRSIQHAYTIQPGFQTSNLALLMVNPSQAGYNEARSKELYRVIRERVSTLPGVRSAAWATGLPFWNAPARTVSIEGAEQRKKSEMIATIVTTVDTGYFDVMGIPLVRGRLFTDGDREESLPVALINEELARERWPGGDALGHRLQLSGDKAPRQVVGVVKNANYTTLGEAPQPCIYLAERQNFSPGMMLYVRAESNPTTLLAPVQSEIRRFDPNIEVSDARTGAKLIEQVLWAPKVGVALMGVFGLLALVLASVGLYGVMAYSVHRRRKEIGVRIALGASPVTVLGYILRNGMLVVGIGIILGLGACLLIGRVLTRLLFGITATDPVSLAAASAVLILVALIACYIPARSATQVDPMTALRDA